MVIFYGGCGEYNIPEWFGMKLNTLISFANSPRPHWREWWDTLFIDSGAFSVFKSGRTIDINEYHAFLEKMPLDRCVYAALDVIGDVRGSFKNYIYHRRCGFNPIPIYHDGEPLEYLHEYCSMTNYVGLSEFVGTDKASRYRFFDRAFSLYPDPSKVKFHGFGVMDPDLILRYPWGSVDAISATTQAFYGRIGTKWGWLRISEKAPAKDKEWMTSIKVSIVKGYVESFGMNWEAACKSDREGKYIRLFLNIQYFEQLRKRVPSTFVLQRRLIPLIDP